MMLTLKIVCVRQIERKQFLGDCVTTTMMMIIHDSLPCTLLSKKSYWPNTVCMFIQQHVRFVSYWYSTSTYSMQYTRTCAYTCIRPYCAVRCVCTYYVLQLMHQCHRRYVVHCTGQLGASYLYHLPVTQQVHSRGPVYTICLNHVVSNT